MQNRSHLLLVCWLVARKKEISRSKGDPIGDSWLVELKASGYKEG